MKTAIITGASTGIGLAITQKFIQEGMKVIGLARDFSKTKFENSNFQKIELDLRKKVEVDMLTAKIKNVDILVNNAGVGYFDLLEKISEDEIQEMVETNLLGLIFLTQKLIPQLKKGKGDIINIASESALTGRKFGTVYCATKFALRGFSESLADELRRNNVRVTCLNPGMVKSSFFNNKNFQPEDKNGCYLLPEDVAESVWQIINLRKGIVIPEISLMPQVKSIVWK